MNWFNKKKKSVQEFDNTPSRFKQIKYTSIPITKFDLFRHEPIHNETWFPPKDISNESPEIINRVLKHFNKLNNDCEEILYFKSFDKEWKLNYIELHFDSIYEKDDEKLTAHFSIRFYENNYFLIENWREGSSYEVKDLSKKLGVETLFNYLKEIYNKYYSENIEIKLKDKIYF